MTKPSQAMRTCIICGQKKPLTAFLELVGIKGHAYSDICATCRGAAADRKKSGKIDITDQGSSTSGRLQIDNKAKVHLEHEKQEQLKQTANTDHEQKIKKETVEIKKNTELEQHVLGEKKHRESYLEHKSSDTQTKEATAKIEQALTTAKESTVTQGHGFYQEKARINKEMNTETNTQQLGQKTIGLSSFYVQKYVSSTGRSAESLFGNLLGQFLKNDMATQNKKAKGAPPPNKNQTTDTENAKKTAKQSKQPEDPKLALDFVKNNFKKR